MTTVETLPGLLRSAIEVAKADGAEMHYQFSESSETENDTVCVDVWFAQAETEPFLSVSRLVDQLKRHTTLGSIDVSGPPHNRLTVFGARKAENYRITLHLDRLAKTE